MGAATLPTIVSPKSIDRFLTVISSAGVPAKVDTNYLKSVGFKSGNDTALIKIFKTLGFLDGSGVPTDRWRSYKDSTKSKKVLGEAVKAAYSGVFGIYPDANRKDDEAIRNWIRTETGGSDLAVQRMLSTFKTLVGNADFEGLEELSHTGGVAQRTTSSNGQAVQTPVISAPIATKSGPIVNVNIELQIPPTNDPVIYENFFAAMKKYLLDDGKDA